MPLEDSVTYANGKYFFKSFNEPNLSNRPAEQDIFRLSVEGFAVKATVIVLTKEGLLVKQAKTGNKGSLYPVENTEQLTETERQQYFFLKKFFPYHKRKYVHGRQLYIDSMIESTPALRSVAYYRFLMNKATDRNAEPFEYTTKKISITTNQFTYLVDLINASGYWTLPYSNLSTDSDGFGFSLEVNTKNKYNIVSCSTGKTEASTKKLKQACQQMLDAAGVDAGFKIWQEDREK